MERVIVHLDIVLSPNWPVIPSSLFPLFCSFMWCIWFVLVGTAAQLSVAIGSAM
jgi:hypothetical protein